MRLEWLEDLVAVLDHGTLSRAADARNLTQPAFSRRIRTIEEHVGVELIDRERRPARLKPAILAQEDRLRQLAVGLREFTRELRRRGKSTENRVFVAAQHAITTSIAPRVLREHVPDNISLRLRSANRDECYALIMTRQVDFTLVYDTPADRFAPDDSFSKNCRLAPNAWSPFFHGRPSEPGRKARTGRVAGDPLPA